MQNVFSFRDNMIEEYSLFSRSFSKIADVMGEDYPSETFRVLKNNELRQFGEYRTGRLVLAAYDRLLEQTSLLQE